MAMDAERLRAVAGSVVVHLLLVGIVAVAMWERPPPPAVAPSQTIIQARAVDEATALEPVRRREAEAQRKKEAAAEALRKRAEAELAAQQKKAAAEAEKKRLAAERQKAEAEKKRQVEAQQKKAEAEKSRLAEEQRQKDSEAKKRKQEEEAKRKAGEEKLKQALAAEEARLREEEQRLAAQRTAGLVNQYVGAITAKVRGNWLRLPDMPPEFKCKVMVLQIPGGEVVDVRMMESCGNLLLDRSVEAAVWKSSPLPAPPAPELFSREIVINFVPR
jgi:colicin import membrane protein